MNKNSLFVLAIALALLTMGALVVATRPAVPAVASSNAVAVDVRFPGKEADDSVVAGTVMDKHFPGKEQDDLVAPMNVLDRQFPGKEKDDLFMNEPSNMWRTPAYRGYTPSNRALVADPPGVWHTPAYQGYTP